MSIEVPLEMLVPPRVRPYAIRFPTQQDKHSQSEEYCEVCLEGQWRRVRLHDYDLIFSLPGLYEQLFLHMLHCTSPERVVSLFGDVLRDWSIDPSTLRVLELGAGNGMVGEELRMLGVKSLIGIDILPEAAAAAKRDRPGIYDQYFVADLSDNYTDCIDPIARTLPHCLVTVAALGFGDIPATAFINAYNMTTTPGWLVFNIKDSFLSGIDDTGFAKMIRRLSDHEYIQIQSYRRYKHRLSVSGQSLHYVAVVARKLRPITQSFIETLL